MRRRWNSDATAAVISASLTGAFLLANTIVAGVTADHASTPLDCVHVKQEVAQLYATNRELALEPFPASSQEQKQCNINHTIDMLRGGTSTGSLPGIGPSGERQSGGR